MSINFYTLNLTDRPQFQTGIAALEQTAKYPLGDDFFQLDHGEDYFAFFDRLGDVYYHIALDDDFVCAVGAGILRRVSYRVGESKKLVWYLCDLKVHPKYQNRHLSLRLLRYALESNIRLCDRGYAISMNTADGQPTRLINILRQFPLAPFGRSVTLGIYSLDAVAMHQLAPLLIEHRGPISYLSLLGKKDLRLQSNDQVLPLLHVQWGATAQMDQPVPIAGYAHMFCVPEGDVLMGAIAQQGIHPQATASIVSHGMDESDWRFVLTSDI